MATSPICPADFDKANFGASTCDLLTQLLLTNDKLKRFFAWMFDEDCRLSADFVAEFRGVLQPIGSVIWAPVELKDPAFEKEWIEASGQFLNREEYPELFALFGTKFGTDEDDEEFRIPNLNGRTLIGRGTRIANKPPQDPPARPPTDDDPGIPVDPETVPGSIEYELTDPALGDTGIGGLDEIVLTPVQSGIGESHQHGIAGINGYQVPPDSSGHEGSTAKDQFGYIINTKENVSGDGLPGDVHPVSYDVADFKGLFYGSLPAQPFDSDNYIDYHQAHILTTEPIKELTETTPTESHNNVPPHWVGVWYIRVAHVVRTKQVPVQ